MWPCRATVASHSVTLSPWPSFSFVSRSVSRPIYNYWLIVMIMIKGWQCQDGNDDIAIVMMILKMLLIWWYWRPPATLQHWSPPHVSSDLQGLLPLWQPGKLNINYLNQPLFCLLNYNLVAILFCVVHIPGKSPTSLVVVSLISVVDSFYL